MSAILDQTLDLNGQELHRILSVYPLPDFVKNASQDEVCGTDDIHPHQFADQTRRMFPIKNAASTVLSSVFFYEKRAEFTEARAKIIENRLLEAAKYYDVVDEMAALQTKIAEAGQYDETALPDSDFAIVTDGAGGVKERRYPMRNAGEVKAAGDWLSQYSDSLHFADRNKIATHILAAASRHGAAITKDRRYAFEKMAGLGVCASTEAASIIRTRIRAIGNTAAPSPIQEQMEKLAVSIEEHPDSVQHYGTLLKLANTLDQFDRANNLTSRYGDDLERPEDVLFAVTGKVAADLDDELVGNTMTGNYYKRADLNSVPVRDFVDTLGQDFADAISTANAWVDTEKLAAIVPTLPLGDAEEFDAVVAHAGVLPFAQKSAAVGKSISPAEQAELAKQHKPTPGGLWDKIKD